MNSKSILLVILVIFFVSGCSQGLVREIYSHARHDGDSQAATAFVALSNMYLTKEEIIAIENDYKNERNEKRRYYYEFLLAKRTQEKRYIDAFIDDSGRNLSVLVENKTNWISIVSPFYKQIALYSRTNDKALVVLFKLSQIADGAVLETVSDDLSEILKSNKQRFWKVAGGAGFKKSDILQLMED